MHCNHPISKCPSSLYTKIYERDQIIEQYDQPEVIVEKINELKKHTEILMEREGKAYFELSTIKKSDESKGLEIDKLQRELKNLQERMEQLQTDFNFQKDLAEQMKRQRDCAKEILVKLQLPFLLKKPN